MVLSTMAEYLNPDVYYPNKNKSKKNRTLISTIKSRYYIIQLEHYPAVRFTRLPKILMGLFIRVAAFSILCSLSFRPCWPISHLSSTARRGCAFSANHLLL